MACPPPQGASGPGQVDHSAACLYRYQQLAGQEWCCGGKGNSQPGCWLASGDSLTPGQALRRREAAPPIFPTPYSQVQPETLAAAARRGPAHETISTSYLVPGIRAQKLVQFTSAPKALVLARTPAWYRVTW